MGEAHKKEEKPLDIGLPLRELHPTPDGIRGKLDEFDILFRNGRIYAKKTYNDIHITVLDNPLETSGKRAVLKELDVTLVFMFGPEFREVVKNCEVLTEFELEGERRHSGGGNLYMNAPIKFADGQWASFDGEFLKEFQKDLELCRKKLKFTLQYDARLAFVFKAVVKDMGKTEKLVVELADEAERISKEVSVKDNPLLLSPVFKKAKENGVVDKVMLELGIIRMNRNNEARNKKIIEILEAFNELKKKDEKGSVYEA